MRAIDVIVPIYNALADVRQCLFALKQNMPSFARLVLADDASPDPAVVPLLEQFAADAPFKVEVHRRTKNVGFVGNVNHALSLSNNDVVILNSDTLVAPNWLQAMAIARDTDEKIASITPWSNNGEICSFPNLCQASEVPKDLNKIAKRLAIHAPTYPNLPTGVGFCMLMRRCVIERIGAFDESLFGRGYGEENDWCLRATGFGYRNILCDNAYVAHVGGRSFAYTGEKPGGENLKRLLARYPHYHHAVADFIQRDPLKPLREQIAVGLSAP